MSWENSLTVKFMNKSHRYFLNVQQQPTLKKIAYLLYMSTSGFHSRCGGIRKSFTPPYSDEFHRKFISFHSCEKEERKWSKTGKKLTIIINNVNEKRAVVRGGDGGYNRKQREKGLSLHSIFTLYITTMSLSDSERKGLMLRLWNICG